MSGFDDARRVEKRGWELLEPFIEEVSAGRYVLSEKGQLARYLQLIAGDVLYNDANGRLWTVECKVEQRHTGNLFLETWSNRNLDRRADFSERGSNRGWLDHLRSDLLLYYFLDADWLYVVDLFALKRWAFGFCDGSSWHKGNLENYDEKPQRRYDQKNDTHGRLVPVAHLAMPVPHGLGEKFKRFRLLNGLDEDPIELRGQLSLLGAR